MKNDNNFPNRSTNVNTMNGIKENHSSTYKLEIGPMRVCKQDKINLNSILSQHIEYF